MSMPPAKPGELIDVSPLGEMLSETKSHTLQKTPDREVIRLALPTGKQIAEHKAL